MTGTLFKDSIAHQETMIRYRRELHMRAETGFDLPHTCAYIQQVLTEIGYTAKRLGRCGLIATIGEGEETLLLRADMDALPMREKTQLSFTCRNGNAHACGHDLHTAMLLGAALLLKKYEHQLNKRIVLCFQPAEELLAGAKDMLENGLLEATGAQAAMMLHVMNAEGLPPGTVIIPPEGVSAPAADMFDICIKGKGCHGAMPHMGVDVIGTGAHTVLALQNISARELSPTDAHALTVASFRAGEGANVLPDEAVLQGSLRCYDEKTRSFMKERVKTICRLTAETFRAAAEVRWLSGCPPLINHPALAGSMADILKPVLGSERVLLAKELQGNNARSSGSEDFAYITQRIPSIMLAIAAGGINDHPLHHPSVVFNEAVLPYGACAFAAFALKGRVPPKE